MDPKWPKNLHEDTPQRLKEEGVFVRGGELVKIGDKVTPFDDTTDGLQKGSKLDIEDIVTEPVAPGKELKKSIKLRGIEGSFDPKIFDKLST